MSNITNIIMSLHWDDSHRKSCALVTINKYLQENYSCQLEEKDAVYMIAVNYLSPHHFIEVLRNCVWENPEYLQIFWKGEHEDIFTPFGWMELLDSDIDIVSRINALWNGEGQIEHNENLSPIREVKFISSRLTRNPDGSCSVKKSETGGRIE